MTATTKLFFLPCLFLAFAGLIAASAPPHPELRGHHDPPPPMLVSEYNRLEAARKQALATLVGRIIVVSAEQADCRTVDAFRGSANFGAPQPRGTRARVQAVRQRGGALLIHPEGAPHFVAVGVQEGDKALRLDAVDWSEWRFEDGTPLPSSSPAPLPDALEFTLNDPLGSRLAVAFSDISASTGYSTEWRVGDSGVLLFSEEDDECDNASCSVPGAARKRLAVFRAVKAGATTIEFSKGRAWDPDTMFRRTFRVTVADSAVHAVVQ